MVTRVFDPPNDVHFRRLIRACRPASAPWRDCEGTGRALTGQNPGVEAMTSARVPLLGGFDVNLAEATCVVSPCRGGEALALFVMKICFCCPLELSGRHRLVPATTPAPLCLKARAGRPTRSHTRLAGRAHGSESAWGSLAVPTFKPHAHAPEWCECGRPDRLTPPSRPLGDPVWSPPRRTSAI